MLDRYLIRYFLAVVDQGNFSRAAEACHVSQPTLSVGIAKLERIVGHSLFLRSNQRVELTDPGTRFLDHARRIEREFNQVLQSMEMANELPPFRLGVLGSIPASIVADSIAQTRPHQNHRFELVFGSERLIVSHLAKGRIDVALNLVERGGDRFREQPILSEGYTLALPQDHPMAHHQEIAAEQLANDTMMVRRDCEALSETSRFFTERGVRPHFALRSTNDERVLTMVAAGLGVTVIPACHRHPGIVRPRLTGFNLRRTLGWAVAHDQEFLLAAPSPFMQSIAERLKAT